MMMMMEIAYPSIVMDDWRLSVWFNSKGWGEVENEGAECVFMGFFVSYWLTTPTHFPNTSISNLATSISNL